MVRETVAGNAVVSSMRQKPVYTGYSVGAAEHAWRPSPSPCPPSSPPRGEEGRTLGRERKNAGNPSRNDHTDTVRAQDCDSNRFTPVTASVLRSTPSGPHLPPAPLPLPHGERKGERWGGRERMLGTPRAMVAQIWYVPNEKCGFLIRL